MRFPLPAIVGLGLVTQAFGQEMPVPVPVPVVSGHPFSADEVTTRMQRLPNGPPVVPMETTRVYRDSAGRTMIEAPFPHSSVCCPRLLYIFDPVAGVNYFASVEKKIASRQVYTVPRGKTVPANDDPWKPPTARLVSVFPEPPTQYESLGSQLTLRFLVEGRRATSGWPAATNGSTSRPAGEYVDESWYSSELQMMVVKQVYTTFWGFSTTRLENINRSEPDPSLFQIPSDYTIVDGFVKGLAEPK